MDVLFALAIGPFLAFAIGAGCGQVMGWWWARVHGPRVGGAGAAWLALLFPYLLTGLFFLALAVARLGFGTARFGVDGPFDLFVIGVLVLWAFAAGLRRDLRSGAWMLGIAVLPEAAEVFAWLAGAVELNPPLFAPTGGVELGGLVNTPLTLLGAALTLSGFRGSPAAEVPVADADGVVIFDLHTRSSLRAWMLTAVSFALVIPGLVLALRPSLGRTAVRVRIWGEAVEVDGVRLSMAGGSVRLDVDLLGAPVLVLTGRDGALTLPLGGVPLSLVYALRTGLEAATTALRAPPPPSTPEELGRMRHRAAEATVRARS